MGARALTTLEDGTEAVPWVLQNLVSPLLGGIILAAILAAIMSSADSLLTSATSHVVKDIWVETLQPGRGIDERRMLVVSRVVTVIVGLVALVIGLTTPGIVELLIYSYTIYTAGVFIPVIGGLLWQRPGKAAALASLLVGSLVALTGIITGIRIGQVPTEVLAALISAVIFVLVALLAGWWRSAAAGE
jgi:SSS family solute:Na+ symporter